MSGFVTVSSDWSGGTWLTPGFSLGCCVSGLDQRSAPLSALLGI